MVHQTPQFELTHVNVSMEKEEERMTDRTHQSSQYTFFTYFADFRQTPASFPHDRTDPGRSRFHLFLIRDDDG